jgi:transposase
MTTVALTNQTFSMKKNEKGEYTINFPKSKDGKRCSYNLGKMSANIPSGKITKIEVQPYYGCFKMCVTYEDFSLDENAKKIEIIKENPCGIMGIDLGVKNFATITDNLG